MIGPTAQPRAGILDANGIIGLAKGECLAFVPLLFVRTLVPHLVVREVTDPISRQALQNALQQWLSEAEPTVSSLQAVPSLNREADRHVIGLSLDYPGSIIITSDRALIRQAKRLQIATISATRVVGLFAREGLLQSAKTHLDRMIRGGYGIPEDLYNEILRSCGE